MEDLTDSQAEEIIEIRKVQAAIEGKFDMRFSIWKFDNTKYMCTCHFQLLKAIWAVMEIWKP